MGPVLILSRHRQHQHPHHGGAAVPPAMAQLHRHVRDVLGLSQHISIIFS